MSTATGARSLALIHWIVGTMSNTFNAPLVTHSGQCCLQTREGSFGTQRTGSSWASDCPNWWLNVQPQESGLPKKALPAPSSESWTDFFNKKIYVYIFFERDKPQVLSTQGWGSERNSRTVLQRCFPWVTCLIRKLRNAGIQVSRVERVLSGLQRNFPYIHYLS